MEITRALEIAKLLSKNEVLFNEEKEAIKTLCEHVENNLTDDGK